MKLLTLNGWQNTRGVDWFDTHFTYNGQPHQVGNPLISASRMHWLILDLNVRRPNDPWKWPSWINFASFQGYVKTYNTLLN